ncbi:uncharacterized protein BDV17DRAFT_157137 [Aspergillus undulatus]|uniref:uncharacterized protein n=1 Tax=Aspergillus undulatus TaxID=1810928 RepID=UPI003CCE4AFC
MAAEVGIKLHAHAPLAEQRGVANGIQPGSKGSLEHNNTAKSAIVPTYPPAGNKNGSLTDAVANGSDSSTDGPCMEMAVKVMQILQSYSVKCKDSGTLWEDVETFLPSIISSIEKDEPVRMVLPASRSSRRTTSRSPWEFCRILARSWP